eukprot:898432_1
MAFFQINERYNQDTEQIVTSMLMGDEKTYNNFFVVHPSSTADFGSVTWVLNRKYKTLKAVIGLAGNSECVDEYGKDSDYDGIVFKFFVDEQLKYTSNRLAVLSAYENINIDLTNANTLRVHVEKGQTNKCDNAIIADPLLLINPLPLVIQPTEDVCDSAQWQQIGTLSDINDIYAGSTSYTVYDWEFGVRYNSLAPNAVIINGWNRGLRVTTLDDYPMGDSVNSLKLGRAVFTYDLLSNPTDTNWYQYYYNTDNDAKTWSNGLSDCVLLYVRKINSWQSVGTLANIENLLADNEYPSTKYEYGILYNSLIHKVIINRWNVGIRVSTVDSFPQGDDSNALTFGKVIFTKGLRDSLTSNDWYQYYHTVNGDVFRGSNGVSNSVSVFVKQRESMCV